MENEEKKKSLINSVRRAQNFLVMGQRSFKKKKFVQRNPSVEGASDEICIFVTVQFVKILLQ